MKMAKIGKLVMVLVMVLVVGCEGREAMIARATATLRMERDELAKLKEERASIEEANEARKAKQSEQFKFLLPQITSGGERAAEAKELFDQLKQLGMDQSARYDADSQAIEAEIDAQAARVESAKKAVESLKR